MNSITLHFNRKTNSITLLRGGYGKDTILELDSSGNVEITEEIFKAKDTKVIDQYEYEIAEVLSEEQQVILYTSWGMALSIMISSTANVLGIDKRLAKEIITQGERHGILYQGNNNTWKVKDAVIIKSRWLDKAKDIQKESKPIKDMTTEGILGRYAEQAKKLGVPGFEKHTKKGGMSSNSDSDSEVEKQDEEVTVEVIPEEPIKKNMFGSTINIEILRQELAQLQKQYNDPERVDTETCNTFTLIDRMKVLKVQITNTEIAQQEQQYREISGEKLTASGSVTRVERKGVMQVVSNSVKQHIPKRSPVPVKKSFAKGKPAQVKGVDHPKKRTTR